MMHRFYSPKPGRARAAIDVGRIGLPLMFDLEWLVSAGLSGEAVERPEGVTDPALSSGGEIMNSLTSPVMIIRGLTGVEARSVYAEVGTFFFRYALCTGTKDVGDLPIEPDHGQTSVAGTRTFPCQLDLAGH